MRVAPLERRMVAWGLVESVWPAVGTVLVHGDIAYANAGRTSEADGGIAVVAFKPETGETLWTRVMPPGHRQLNDLLDVRNDSLAWRYIRLDLKSGKSKPLAPKISAQGGMMDGSWTVTHKRRAGNAFVLGRSVADLMAWNDKLVVTPSYAVDRSRNEAPPSGKPEPKNAGNPDTPKPIGAEEFSWQPALPGQVEAMAMAGNAVFYAGRPSKAETNACTGFIVAVSIADGRNLWELSLDSPPTYDGLAVARDRVYLSLQDGTLLCFDK
jgi:outer membrane protein assembly factor BamB